MNRLGDAIWHAARVTSQMTWQVTVEREGGDKPIRGRCPELAMQPCRHSGPPADQELDSIEIPE